MTRSILAMAAAILSLCVSVGGTDANPGMSGPGPARTAPPVRTTPPVRVAPRYVPPVRVVPRYVPPVVVVRPPVVIPAAPVAPSSGVVLTKGAWVGYNPLTGMYSIAFDSPGVSGLGILINAGYSNVVMSQTDWITATTYLKSVGAPGW